MSETSYIVATIRPWNIAIFHQFIKTYPGCWHLITNPRDLQVEMVNRIKPAYIFFPHWNHIVPKEILESAECICFHETDLPYGRGGSPLQNLISRGHKETVVSALRMTEELDAGPIYLKRPLSLEGLAEEIYLRTAKLIADMISEIISQRHSPRDQQGVPTLFARRTSDQSKIPSELALLDHLFDHIRMLDATEYPRAFLEYGGFRYEISRPALRTEAIEATVHIRPIRP
jgi:methionyl-tRNA formyltransferase